MRLFPVRHSFRTAHLAATAFVTGTSVMAVELTSSRVLAPFFGTSILVWTSLIVSNLLGLTLGYWSGGKLAESGRDHRELLGFSLGAGAALLALGLWIVQGFSLAVSAFFFGFTVSTLVLFLGSLVVSFSIFALPVFLVALAGPIILKEWTRSDGDVGAVAGRYFAVTSLGSIAGTLLPTLVLVPSFGTRVTISAVSALLAFAALPFLTRRRAVGFVLFMALLFVMIWQQAAVERADLSYRTESPYQLIRVMDAPGGATYVRGDAVIMSAFAPEGERTGMYYDYLSLLPLWSGAQEGTPRRFGVIGFAAGGIAKQFAVADPQDRTTTITGVDVDRAMMDVGERFFGVSGPRIHAVAADGRMFLLRADEPFDAIAFDAFSAVSTPPHLASREFFALVRSRLNEGGIIGMNVLSPSLDAPLLSAITNTMASVFTHVRVVPVGGSAWNHVVLASDAPLDPDLLASRLPDGYGDVADALRYESTEVAYDPDKLVLTDDHAPTEFMTDAMAIAEAFR